MALTGHEEARHLNLEHLLQWPPTCEKRPPHRLSWRSPKIEQNVILESLWTRHKAAWLLQSNVHIRPITPRMPISYTHVLQLRRRFFKASTFPAALKLDVPQLMQKQSRRSGRTSSATGLPWKVLLRIIMKLTLITNLWSTNGQLLFA